MLLSLWSRQLDIGHGKHTDDSDKIILPPNLRLQKNTVEALIHHIYPGLSRLQPPLYQYFSERMMLSSRKDSVVNNRPDEGELMYPAEYLNSINCSGLPLAKLKLKIGCPVMVFRNLFPAEGVCNGTRGIVSKMFTRVIEIELMSEELRGKKVFIPRITLTPSPSQIPFNLERKQFPLKICFAMTINKSQGQSVKYVGLDMKSSVFTHGQFYVAVSRVKSVNNIKVIWDENLGDDVTKNIEILLD